MVFLDNDLGIPIYRGQFYLAITVLSDLFGLGLLLGVVRAWHRRYIEKPDLLHTSSADGLALFVLALLVVQGFLLEALRIHVTLDPWKYYSPVGFALSKVFWPLAPNASRVLHFVLWWFHTITVFAVIAVLPYTKFLHILASSANLYFQEDGKPKGSLRYPGDLDALLEKVGETGDESLLSIGVSTVNDLSWKKRLELDACTSCGRCQDVCPAYNSGKPLSPKWLILDARDHMLGLQASGKFDGETSPSPMSVLDRSLLSSLLLRSRKETDKSARAKNPLVQNSARNVGLSVEEEFAGGVMDENVFWTCTTCRACMEVCPVGIEHVDLITDVRRNMAILNGKIPSEAQGSLRAIENRGNPFGPPEARVSWSDGLSVNILEPGAEVEVLYWVGCISAYDRRKQKIARAMVELLNRSGLSWGMLGNRESCSGDPARRLGEENLFQSSAKKNIETLKSIRFQKIVANCPHCFNTLKNEYQALEGGTLTVVHHTQLLKELLESGRLKIKENAGLLDENGGLTYHDPCYLGRYNDTYEAPRDVLYRIGGVKRPDEFSEKSSSGAPQIHEMASHREKGMCCGAGGGHFWMDLKIGERVNVRRIAEAEQTGAKTIATACPFCLHMLEDGLKLRAREEDIGVRDIAELVAENLS